MKNSFLYKNAKGRKSLTPFAWSLMGIFAVLILVAAFGITNANTTRSVVEATPQPITLATVTAMPESTEEITAVDSCPTDPSQWDFVDVSPDSNYKRIEPACVYDNLARTVAWRMLSTTYGYDIADAGNLLGFGSYSNGGVIAPYHELATLVIRQFQGDTLAEIEPLFPAVGRGLHQWEVGPDKDVFTATYMLQGCYRTYDVVGNEKQYISDEYELYSYEAICQVAYDAQPSGWYIADYGENIVYSGQIATGRALMYFGYDSAGASWYFLGISNDSAYAPAPESLAAEYELMQEWYGAPVWGDLWFRTLGFSAISLPAGWEQRNTVTDREALLEKINSATY